jgi:hypothetical protein
MTEVFKHVTIVHHLQVVSIESLLEVPDFLVLDSLFNDSVARIVHTFLPIRGCG